MSLIPTSIGSYNDYLERLPLEELRTEARLIDHDCRLSPDDGCNYCSTVTAASRETLIQIILENGENL